MQVVCSIFVQRSADGADPPLPPPIPSSSFVFPATYQRRLLVLRFLCEISSGASHTKPGGGGSGEGMPWREGDQPHDFRCTYMVQYCTIQYEACMNYLGSIDDTQCGRHTCCIYAAYMCQGVHTPPTLHVEGFPPATPVDWYGVEVEDNKLLSTTHMESEVIQKSLSSPPEECGLV